MPFWSFKPIAVTHAESFKKLCEHCGVPTSYHHGITLEEYLEMYLTVCQGGGGVPFAIRDLIETALKKVTSGDTSFLRPWLNAGFASLMIYALSWERYGSNISEFEMEEAARKINEVYGYR